MELKISWIKQRIEKEEYIWTLHADQERRSDNLEIQEVEKAIIGGEVLEEYLSILAVLTV